MSDRPAWFGKYWVPRRKRFRYVPITRQGWLALLAAIAAPHLVWLVPSGLWPHPLLRLPASMALLLLAIALLFRLVKARSIEIEPG
jgi:hypothetical protein